MDEGCQADSEVLWTFFISPLGSLCLCRWKALVADTYSGFAAPVLVFLVMVMAAVILDKLNKSVSTRYL
jgi:hypothetical protein